ncbi:MAG: integrin alpha, partial [Candidatus Alcyoniella australis]|nr:integrin alpha [Candidatus Alcyoniella australis]
YLGSRIMGLSFEPDWNAGLGQDGAHFGSSVSTAGDVNGDGYDDVIVGAPDYSRGPQQDDEGGAFVYHGTFFGCEIDGEHYGPGEANPDNVCLLCEPDQSQDQWSYNDGSACDDGLFCNGEDACLEGDCQEHAGDPCETQDEVCNEQTDACDDADNDQGDDDDDSSCCG